MNAICSGDFGRRDTTRFCFWRSHIRAKARRYARLPRSRQDLSALADYERSSAIYRRVLIEIDFLSRSDG